MTIRILLLVLAATVVAACGGDPTTAGGPKGVSQAKAQKAMLDYAQCMRDHGVDMPDPQFSGNGGFRVQQRGPKGGADPDKLRSADGACAHFRDSIKPPAQSAAQQSEFRKAALANAQCMREHGVDMPDPQFDANGGARIELKGKVNPDDPKFQAAQKACQKTLPGGAGLSTSGAPSGQATGSGK
jgi:hypothetical protein